MSSTSNPFRTPEFLALFQEWNEKLEEDGFQDAEDHTLPDSPLKCWHSFRFKKTTPDQRESYYVLASRLLHNGFPFRSDVSRRVWELHCQGQSIRRIATTLRQQLLGYKSCKRDKVHLLIKEIQKRSGLKVK